MRACRRETDEEPIDGTQVRRQFGKDCRFRGLGPTDPRARRGLLSVADRETAAAGLPRTMANETTSETAPRTAGGGLDLRAISCSEPGGQLARPLAPAERCLVDPVREAARPLDCGRGRVDGCVDGTQAARE